MSIKQVVSLTTLSTANEQSGVSPITVTTSGNSREYRELSSFNRAIVFLDVSAASGSTPSLTVLLQVQDPQSLKWSQAAAFPAQTGATGGTPITPLTLELYGLNYRLAWTVSGGSPSFTFSCNAVVGSEEPVS